MKEKSTGLTEWQGMEGEEKDELGYALRIPAYRAKERTVRSPEMET